MTDVLLVADTHLGPGDGGRLVDRIADELARADVVLHAGDITDRSVLDALGAHHVVHAVLGNNDRGIDLPERVLVDIDGCRFALVHDSGAAHGRTARLRRWFPDADVVVFGHSHQPWHDTDARASDGHVQHHVNPGSAMQRRRAPACTVAHVRVEHGRVTAVEHIAVGPH
jgi:uncharacterized protein